MTGLVLGLLLTGILAHGPAASAADSAPSQTDLKLLSQTLSVLQDSLKQTEQVVLAQSPEALRDPKWIAVNSTLGDLRRGLIGIRTALGAPASSNVARTAPAPRTDLNPAPSMQAQPETQAAPPTPAVNDEPAPAQTANVADTAPWNGYSWAKILAALVILVGGGALIAFSLRENRPSSVATKTEAARNSQEGSPGAGPMSPGDDIPEQSPNLT